MSNRHSPKMNWGMIFSQSSCWRGGKVHPELDHNLITIYWQALLLKSPCLLQHNQLCLANKCLLSCFPISPWSQKRSLRPSCPPAQPPLSDVLLWKKKHVSTLLRGQFHHIALQSLGKMGKHFLRKQKAEPRALPSNHRLCCRVSCPTCLIPPLMNLDSPSCTATQLPQ